MLLARRAGTRGGLPVGAASPAAADPGSLRRQARDLLVDAYRRLGRDALAHIADVHARHRDLLTVDVLVAQT